MERITITSLLVACLFLFSFVKNEVSTKENDLQNTVLESVSPKKTPQNPQNTEGGILAKDSSPEALMQARWDSLMAEKTPIFDMPKGSFIALQDSAPQRNVRFVSSEQQTQNGFKVETNAYKVNDEFKKEDRNDTIMRFEPANPTNHAIQNNLQNANANVRSHALEKMLIEDGFITNGEGYIVRITPYSLKINGYDVIDKLLHTKYTQVFLPEGSKEMTYSKLDSNKREVGTTPKIDGFVWEKDNGIWVLKNTNGSKPKINNPAIPPNAQPGRCYAYCYNPDGTAATEWFEVVCGDLIDNAVFINALRDKLIATGDLSASHIDRAITKEMKVAITAYQKRNKLPVGNLNEPTITHMGIEMPRHPPTVKKN